MTNYQHPMRHAQVSVYEILEGTGPRFIANFEPLKTYPMRFSGETRETATQAALAFRDDAIRRNEAAYIARMKGLSKYRAERKNSLNINALTE